EDSHGSFTLHSRRIMGYDISEGLSLPTEAPAGDVECITLPVESPLTATFDPTTGVLTLESTIHRDSSDRKLVRLRLDFAPDAAHGFIRMVQAVEEELGALVVNQACPSLLQ